MIERNIHYQQSPASWLVACGTLAVFCITDFSVQADEQRVIAKVKSLHGEVTIDPRSQNAIHVTFANRRVRGDNLTDLSSLSDLRLLDVSGTDIRDDGLKFVTALKTLTAIDLTDARVTGPGLLHLRDLSKFESLGLGGILTTDMTMRYVR